MLIRLIVVVLGVLWVVTVHAQTQKSGEITSDETWSNEVHIVGDVLIKNGVTVTVNPGTTITFVTNNAVIYLPDHASTAQFLLMGTSTQRISVATSNGVTGGRIGKYGTYYSTGIRAEYTDFSDIGNTSNVNNFALFHSPQGAEDFFIVRNCTFTNCYMIEPYTYGSGAYVEVSDNDFRSSTGDALKLVGTAGSLTNRIIRNNTSDANFLIYTKAHVFSNVLYANDVQLSVQVSSDESLIEKNYIHNPLGDSTSQALPVNQDDVVIRDNFVCGGVQSVGLKEAMRAQVYENVIQSVASQHEHTSGLPPNGLFARNIMIGEPVYGSLMAGNQQVTNVTVKNNIINGNGSPALWLNHGATQTGIADVRNNIFYDCDNAIYGAVYDESSTTDSLIAMDYNCFYSTNASPDNYHDSIDISSKTERVSAGFGLNDLTVGGAVNQQVDPGFVNPILYTTVTPSEMMNRTRTIDEILAEIRAGYAVGSGSPCIDAGDPRDDGDPDVTDGQRDIGLERTSLLNGTLVVFR